MTLPKILRQNPKQSLKDFKKGLNNLTPKDHMIAKKTGHFWGILGASTASIGILLQVPYSINFLPGLSKFGFGILVGAIAYLQFVEWRNERQKLRGFEKLNNSIEKETKGDEHGI